MSPILINAGASGITTTTIPEEPSNCLETVTEEESKQAREERKQTGRSIAIIIFFSLGILAFYHIVQQKTTILAGVLVPALILFTYLFFVIHISSREKEKRRKQLESVDSLELSIQSSSKKPELQKKISNVSIPSISSLPSTSGISTTSRSAMKHNLPKSSSFVKIDPQKKPRPFVKAPSQSHLPVRNLSNFNIEHERKKLKKSKSFDKNNSFLNQVKNQNQ